MVITMSKNNISRMSIQLNEKKMLNTSHNLKTKNLCQIII